MRINSEVLDQVLFARLGAELIELRNQWLKFSEKIEEELVRQTTQKIRSLTDKEKLELILGYLTESPTPYFLKWLLQDGYFPRYYFQKKYRLIKCEQCGRIKTHYGKGMCKRCYNRSWRKGNFFKKEAEF